MKRVEKQEWRNQLILDNALDYAILTADMNGLIVSWSPGAEKLFGWKPGEVIGQPLDILFTEEDRLNKLPETRQQMASLHRIDAVERFHQRKDGTTFWASGDLQALYSDDGKQQGFLKIVRDRTDEQLHSESLRLSEERLRLAQQAAGIGAFEIDRDRNMIEATPQFLKLLGFKESSELPLDDFYSVIVDSPRQIAKQMLQTRQDESLITHLEFQIKRADTKQLRWIGYWAEAAPKDVGKSMKHRILGVLQDITERREAQEKQAILSSELAHRVKNILAIVQSIANQTLTEATSMTKALQDFSVRLNALAHAQDILTQGATNSADLKQIVESSLDIHDKTKNRFVVSGPPVALSPQTALSMALALHELSTNAVKYGALSSKTGIIEIIWTLDKNEFHFSWRERGGPTVHAPTKLSFGSKLITRLLPARFNGHANLSYAPEGFSFELSAPRTPDNFPPQ
ncbi:MULTISPECIES: sensor histidine kinase [Bartonella]|uniref:Blue-light-activated histidine kinase n=1 Tax=Bartonella choladocola TaxID=2750995 RepID=A0A1U9MKY4_9HYPH|nr:MULTISPECIES: PAS domain S-box protein [Bartonella]AQT48398.1 PAS domain S-box-containing protein [Bartonella choladocola]MBH9974982.1 PAS domain S-box protein [Bartonella choladocola]MBI0014588.1 PAS domain S-box protein [Bartonella sp. B10834G3]MBI0139386.1 PAS domain S-box protein [Bartonella choladocola]